MPSKTRSANVQNGKSTKLKEQPFLSPADSDGPPVPPARPALPRTVSLMIRLGRAGFRAVVPMGFPTEYDVCYRNAALSLLMKIPPFVGYLNHIHLQTKSKDENVLLELNGMATAYW
jgi:hypothetical protein